MLNPGTRENFACVIRNPVLWNPEYRSRNPDDGIYNQSYTEKYLESRIQNCLGLPYKVQNLVLDFLTWGDCF